MVRRILSDSQWARVALLLPGKDGDPGRSARDNREFLEAVLWIARTGSPWRDLPDEFGLWNSVFQRFRRWDLDGAGAKGGPKAKLKDDESGRRRNRSLLLSKGRPCYL